MKQIYLFEFLIKIYGVPSTYFYKFLLENLKNHSTAENLYTINVLPISLLGSLFCTLCIIYEIVFREPYDLVYLTKGE